MKSIIKTPRAAGALLLTALGMSCAVAGVRALQPMKRAADVSRAAETYHRLPLSFEPNQGQAADGVRYVSRGRGYGLYLAPTQAVLGLTPGRDRATASTRRANRGSAGPNSAAPTFVRMALVGANPSARMEALDRQSGVSNYFIGKNPRDWRTNIPNYGKVAANAVYPGVDLVYYGNQRRLEYDFIVRPGATPDRIRMRFDGVKDLRLSRSGELLLETPAGTVTQKKPFVYQNAGNRRAEVRGEYVMLASNEVGFRVEGYDTARPLVIDPVLEYSTFIGGDGREEATDVAIDDDGAAYMTGLTASVNGFPGIGTVTNLQAANAGGADAFVVKMNADGTGLVYSTYFGGSGDENVYMDPGNPADPGDDQEVVTGALALDATRQVYVTGSTSSIDFPLARPIQVDNAGSGDAFLMKLNADGNALVYSTYLGGRGLDAGHGIAVQRVDNPNFPGDPAQATYYANVVGETSSGDFPTVNGFQPGYRGGIRDAFVARVNAAGSGLIASSYLGGTGEDRAYAVAVNRNGNLFVTGTTLSFDDPRTPAAEGFPATAGSFQPTNQGSSDAFVARFNVGATGLDYASYLGGSGENAGTGIGVDEAGNAYVCGFTTATDFPTTNGAFDETWNGGESDAFIVKVNPGGSALAYSTYLGGDAEDVASRLAISLPATDPVLVSVTGFTRSSDFPVRSALRTSPVGGSDAFVAKLLADGSDVEYSTYLGGAQDDRGTGIAVNSRGLAAVSGTTRSPNFPRVRSLDSQLNDGVSTESDAFLARLTGPPAAPARLTGAAVDSTTIRLNWTDESDNETAFEVERRLPSGAFQTIAVLGANVTTYDDTGLTPATDYIYRVRGTNAEGGGPYSNVITVRSGSLPPNAPINLAVTPVSRNSLRLNWTDTSNNETEFIIERSTDGTTFTELRRIGPNAQSFTDTGLQPNTLYYYQVFAGNTGGRSAASNIASGTTLDNPPAAPTGVSAVAVSASQIDLQWTPGSANQTGFRILRSLTPSNFATVATLGAAIRNYSDVGLRANTRYYYQVVATNGSGDSPASATVSATTRPAAPTAPAGLTATVLSSSSIRLNWRATGTNHTSFKLERSQDGGNTYTRIATLPATQTTYTNGGLTPDTTYFYRVAASNSGGDSPYSNEANATTRPVAPISPTALRATAVSQTAIELVWTDRADNEQGFRLERSLDGQTFTQIATILADEEAYTNTGLRPETKYFYRLRAFNGGGNSAYSATASATTLPNPPTRPQGLTARVAGPTSVRLAWTDASNNEASFRVERSTDDGVTFSEVASLAPDSNVHTDNGLAPDSTYVYRIRAVNAGGESFSNTARVTTPPAAPSGLNAAAVSNREIRVLWNNNSSTATAFLLERREVAGGNFVQIRRITAPTTDFLDTGLKGSTAYAYRVRAESPAGASAYSAEARATTLPDPPGAPSNLTATVVSQSEVRLDWRAATGATNHEVERSADDEQTWTTLTSLGGAAKTYRDTGLTADTEYLYRVRATNAGGASAYSNVVRASTLPGAPGAPNSLTVTALSSTSLKLDWASGGSQDGFRVQRARAGGGFSLLTTTTDTTFTDRNLSPNTQYTYQVIAFNRGGDSAPSNRADGLTLPAAPTNLQAQATGTQVRLTWAHAGGADGFRIESSQGGGSNWQPIAAVPAGARSYTDTGLLPSTAISYRVRAYNASGDSENSNIASATTGVGLSSITLRKTGVKGGRAVRGEVTLTGPAPAGGVRVNLSSNSGNARLPASVLVPAGRSSVEIRVRTTRPRRRTFATISAELDGRTVSTTLTIRR